jgi:hypothetical protein
MNVLPIKYPRGFEQGGNEISTMHRQTARDSKKHAAVNCQVMSHVSCIQLLVLWVCIFQGFCAPHGEQTLLLARVSPSIAHQNPSSAFIKSNFAWKRTSSLSCSLGSCTILHHSEEETVISPVVAVEAPFNLSSREGRAVTSGPGLIPSLQFFGEAGK